MLYLIIAFLIGLPIYHIVKPLFTIISLKIQFGKAVYCKYVPIIGFVHLLRKSQKQHNDAYRWISDIVKNNPDVKIIASNAFNKPVLILLDPDYYKPLFLEHEKLSKHDTSGIKDVLMREGLLFSEGKKWKSQRLLLGEHFLFEKLQQRIPMMNEVINEKIGTQQIIKVFDFICSITGDIAIRSFFGDEAKGWKIDGRDAQIELGDITASFVKLRVNNLLVYLKQRIFGTLTWQYCIFKPEIEIKNRVMKFKEDTKQIIFRRRDNILLNGIDEEKSDFLDAYMKIFLTQNMVSIDRIETNEIIAQFITLFIAGTDTTGALITNSLLFLSENTEYIEQLQQEVEAAIVDGSVTFQSLHKLVLVEAFLKEVLRIRPSLVFPIAREPLEEIKVKDLTLKKGWLLLYGNSFANRNEKNYDNSQQFDPKRWLKPEPIKEDNGFINIPFAAGGRNCIGQHMAMIEAKIVFAHIIKNYHIQRNPAVRSVIWPSRGVLTFSPYDAIILKKK